MMLQLLANFFSVSVITPTEVKVTVKALTDYDGL